MNEFVFSNALRLLADKYSLRYVERSQHYLGIYQGLCLDLSSSPEELYFYFLSPEMDLTDHLLDQFQQFKHLKSLGIPPEWLRGSTTTNSSGSQVLVKNSCRLTIDRDLLGKLTEEQFLSIPEAVASDLQALGAPAELPACCVCGNPGPQELYYYGDIYQYACTGCLKDLKDQIPGGQVLDTTPVNWPLASSALAVGCVLFAGAWGLMQQSDRVMTEQMALVAPFFGALLLARGVAQLANGVSLLLRVLTLVGTVFSVFVGNIWGMKAAFLKQGIAATWTQAIEFYFTQYLVNNGVEGWYLLGGFAGAWLGSRMLKARGIYRID